MIYKTWVKILVEIETKKDLPKTVADKLIHNRFKCNTYKGVKTLKVQRIP